MLPPRLIVNADDFGRTAGTNQGIVDAHRRGIVTSATLMVNQPAAEEAAALAREIPTLGVGIHINLTDGPPTLPPPLVPSLVNADGVFPKVVERLESADPVEVQSEIRAQIRRFALLMGRLPTHIDGHHHCHEVPSVLEAVIAVAGEMRLPVRSPTVEVRARLWRAGVRTTEGFVRDFYGEKATVAVLVGILARLLPGVTELMCHPAVVDEALLAGSSYAAPRAQELLALTDPRVQDKVEKAGIVLTDFGRL